MGAGDHLVALNLTMALSQEKMWDIRVMQTDDPTDKSDHAKFYVSILDEVNYALYAAGQPYRACEESNMLNSPTNCLSIQVHIFMPLQCCSLLSRTDLSSHLIFLPDVSEWQSRLGLLGWRVGLL